MNGPKWWYEPGKGVAGGKVFERPEDVPEGWLDTPTGNPQPAPAEPADGIEVALLKARIAELEEEVAALRRLTVAEPRPESAATPEATGDVFSDDATTGEGAGVGEEEAAETGETPAPAGGRKKKSAAAKAPD